MKATAGADDGGSPNCAMGSSNLSGADGRAWI
jgi:hypothetical protein